MRGAIVSFLCKVCVIQTVPCCDAILCGKEVTCILSSAILDVVEKRCLQVLPFTQNFTRVFQNEGLPNSFENNLWILLNLSYSVQEQQGNQKLVADACGFGKHLTSQTLKHNFRSHSLSLCGNQGVELEENPFNHSQFCPQRDLLMMVHMGLQEQATIFVLQVTGKQRLQTKAVQVVICHLQERFAVCEEL